MSEKQVNSFVLGVCVGSLAIGIVVFVDTYNQDLVNDKPIYVAFELQASLEEFIEVSDITQLPTIYSGNLLVNTIYDEETDTTKFKYSIINTNEESSGIAYGEWSNWSEFVLLEESDYLNLIMKEKNTDNMLFRYNIINDKLYVSYSVRETIGELVIDEKVRYKRIKKNYY